ncbi:MAG: hypothetical protein LBF97_06030 [Elusimicrobiota bacterium]|jgi:hypothetical protein|nr:hypothetical protein [Elusimicrobiota bacterium]
MKKIKKIFPIIKEMFPNATIEDEIINFSIYNTQRFFEYRLFCLDIINEFRLAVVDLADERYSSTFYGTDSQKKF